MASGDDGGSDRSREALRRAIFSGKRPAQGEQSRNEGLLSGSGLPVGMEDLDGALTAALASQLESGSSRGVRAGGTVHPTGSDLGKMHDLGGFGGQAWFAGGSCKQEKVSLADLVGGLGRIQVNTVQAGGHSLDGVARDTCTQFGQAMAEKEKVVSGLDLIGSGRSFMQRFELSFIDHFDCPPGYGASLLHEIVPAVQIRGSSPHYFSVAIEVVGSRVCFSKGWEAFVEAEKIVSGDFGLFVLVRPNVFEMRLFDYVGNEKPMAARPAAWNLFVAFGEQDPHGPPPVAAATQQPTEFAVPAHLLGMQFDMGPRIVMSGPLMQALNDIWLNYDVDFPLYACKLNHSHARSGSFYFSTGFSKLLPALPKPVSLFGGGDPFVFGAVMKKRIDDGLARICSGWHMFVRFYDFQEGDVFVFAVRLNGGRITVRLFRVPGA